MHKKIPALATAVRVATLAAVAAPSLALAGGFSLNEQSASAMGTANAGAAANPENATTVMFNPAGMSQLSGHHPVVWCSLPGHRRRGQVRRVRHPCGWQQCPACGPGR